MEYEAGTQVQRKGSKVVWSIMSSNERGVSLFSTEGFATRWISKESFDKNWKVIAS